MQTHELPLLAELHEAEVGVPITENPPETAYQFRRAVRAVLFNEKGQTGLLHATNDGYHKLAGGGVERVGNGYQQEENMATLRRELLEETGYEAFVRDGVGKIVEAKDGQKILQLSECYIADVVGEQQPIELTEDEQKAGLTLEWMSLDEAIATMERDNPPSYLGKFIRARDLILLKRAREIVNQQTVTRAQIGRTLAASSDVTGAIGA